MHLCGRWVPSVLSACATVKERGRKRVDWKVVLASKIMRGKQCIIVLGVVFPSRGLDIKVPTKDDLRLGFN